MESVCKWLLKLGCCWVILNLGVVQRLNEVMIKC